MPVEHCRLGAAAIGRAVRPPFSPARLPPPSVTRRASNNVVKDVVVREMSERREEERKAPLGGSYVRLLREPCVGSHCARTHGWLRG